MLGYRAREYSCEMRKGCLPDACATIGFFTAFFSVSGLITSTLSIYVNSQVSSLERQFGFSSTQSGLIMSADEIGFLTISLLIGYFAPRLHIPRLLAASTIMYGVSALLCIIPYALTKTTRNADQGFILQQTINSNFTSTVTGRYAAILCQIDNNKQNMTSSCYTESGSSKTNIPNEYPSLRNPAIICITIGMVIQGIAKAPRYPLVSEYVDENGDKSKTGWYLGIMTSVAFFGPLLSYGLGGVFSKTYVTLEDVGITTRDPRWIGAWWLGFLVFGLISISVGIPLLIFPRHLKQPNAEYGKLKKQRKQMKNMKAFRSEAKGIFKALWRIIQNLLYTLILVAGVSQLLAVASYVSFLPKYLEHQFSIPSWHANYILAVCLIASTSLGTFLGGALTRRITDSPPKLLIVLVILQALSTTIFSFGFYFGCDSTTITGPKIKGYKNTLTMNSCSESCGCDDKNYFPICGPDGATYFSPCYAGCTVDIGKKFQNCTCTGRPGETVHTGTCETSCPYLYPFVVILFLSSMFSAMKIMPIMVVKIRTVKNVDKALGVSLSAFMTSLFGWLPGPLLVGRLIDSACSLWKTECGVRGACALYDLNRFRKNIHGFSFALRAFVIFVFMVAYLKVRKMKSWDQGGLNEDGKIKAGNDNEKEMTTSLV